MSPGDDWARDVRDGASALAALRAYVPSSSGPARPASSRAERRANDRRVLEAGEAGAPDRPPRRRGLAPRARRCAGLDWERDDFQRARRVSGSASSAREALSRLPRCYALRVERAALAMRRTTDGRRVPTRTLAHVVARRIVALAAVLFHAGRSSKRRGMARIVRGRTRGMFVTLFRGEGRAQNERQRARLSVSTFFATSHHGRTDDPWDCGAMVALHRAGAVWKHQPPAACAGAFQGKDRDGRPRAFNEYHLTERACSSSADETPRPLVDWPGAELELRAVAPSSSEPDPP